LPGTAGVSSSAAVGAAKPAKAGHAADVSGPATGAGRAQSSGDGLPGRTDAGSGAAAAGNDIAAQSRGIGAAMSPGFAANRLSPAVRRLLSESNLDPSAIRGTGQGGRITVEDVLAAIAAGRHGGAAGGPAGAGTRAASDASATGAGAAVAALSVSTATSPANAAATLASAAGDRVSAATASAARAAARPEAIPAAPASDVVGGSRRIPHTPVRKRIAEHMVQSLLHTAPHVTTVFEADMTAVLAHRQKHRDEFAKRGAPLTLTAYFLQATVDGMRAVPEVNSRWTDSALEVFDAIHIGVGTALEEGGLVVPVLRDVQSRDLFATAEGLSDLVTRAREGRLTPADVRGGTFTISNHGVSGSLVATPIIINQPQSAILGVGKLEKRPVVVEEGGEERIAIRPRCYVTLTIDHRVMDGHQANRFLETFVARLTNWA
jgi:2-oxoglutarate dehydrogenase E2 component (dihydrolipoamide succinyltransferase)